MHHLFCVFADYKPNDDIVECKLRMAIGKHYICLVKSTSGKKSVIVEQRTEKSGLILEKCACAELSKFNHYKKELFIVNLCIGS